MEFPHLTHVQQPKNNFSIISNIVFIMWRGFGLVDCVRYDVGLTPIALLVTYLPKFVSFHPAAKVVALHDGDVLMFVCLFVCSFDGLSPACIDGGGGLSGRLSGPH